MYGDLAWLSDIESGRYPFDLYPVLVKYPEAALGKAAALPQRRDDAQADPRQRHDSQHPVELAEHGIGVADPGVESLLFEYERKTAVSNVEYLLPFHPSSHGLIDVAGKVKKLVPECQDRSRVLGRMEQARYDRVLIPSKQLSSLVQGNRGGLRTLEARPHVPLPFRVHRLDGPHRGNEVRNLVDGTAHLTPVPNVFLARILSAMFDLADLGEVPSAGVGQRACRQPGVPADVSEASP